MPRIARRYTIQCSLPNTHTVHIELDGGRQTGREGGRQRRSEEGWRVGGNKRKDGGTDYVREGASGSGGWGRVEGGG